MTGDHDAAIEAESKRAWLDVLKVTSRRVRQAVALVVKDGAETLTDEFYQRMQQDWRAAAFLDQQQVQTRLRGSLRRWMVELFSAQEDEDLPKVIKRQVEIGVVHARIRLPVDLISAGMRLIKRGIRRRIEFAPLDDAERLMANTFVSDLLHLSDSLMTHAYIRDIKDAVRHDEAFRQIMQSKSSAFEQARQRAALAEWVETLVMSVWEGVRPLPRLRDSIFGIWVHHKGAMIFDHVRGYPEFMLSIDILDNTLIPRLEAAQKRPDTETALAAVKDLLGMLRMQLGEMFDLLSVRDDGMDRETQAADRRYLPAILSREINSHQQSGRAFCLLLVDIRLEGLQGDAMNSARSRVMQSSAHLVADSLRTTDHLFRYSDSSFMVVAVETARERAATMAMGIADRLRQSLTAGQVSGFVVPIEPRVSIGIAEYDNHPDYQYFIQRAELALAESVSGRRQVRIAR